MIPRSVAKALRLVAFAGSYMPESTGGRAALAQGLIAETGVQVYPHRLTAKGMQTMLDLGIADEPPLP